MMRQLPYFWKKLEYEGYEKAVLLELDKLGLGWILKTSRMPFEKLLEKRDELIKIGYADGVRPRKAAREIYATAVIVLDVPTVAERAR